MLKKIITIVLGAVLIIGALAGIGTLANRGKTISIPQSQVKLPDPVSSNSKSQSSTPAKPPISIELKKALAVNTNALNDKINQLQAKFREKMKLAKTQAEMAQINSDFSNAVQKVVSESNISAAKIRKKYGL
jgi:biopolymer transport protein ExbD